MSAGKGDSTSNKIFIPFNFSSVMPFDALANSVSQLPTLHPVEPYGAFSNNSLLLANPPSNDEQSEMARLMTATIQDEEWNRNISDDIRLAMRAEYDRQTSWLPPFCDRLSSSIQQSFKRSNTMQSPVTRSTPKRPRPQNVATPSPKHPCGPAAAHSSHISEPVTPRVRKSPRTSDLSHAQEMKRYEDAGVIDSENFQNFVKVLRSFVHRPRDLASTELAGEGDSDLLATANLSDVYDLDRAIRLVIEQGTLGHASPDLLSRVLVVLQKRVRDCCQKTKRLENGTVERSSITNASLGVFCASTILLVLSAPHTPRVLLVQELLEDLVNILRQVSTSIIFPMYDPLYKSSKPVKGRTQRKRTRMSHGMDANQTNMSHNPSDGTSSDYGESQPTHSYPLVVKKDDTLMNNFYKMLDGFTSLFDKENHIADDVVDRCVVVCIQSLSVTGIVRLQSHAIKLVATIFLWYPARHIYILDEARESVKIIPAARKHLRTYQLSESHCAVRPCSALLCLLLCIASSDPEERKSRIQQGSLPKNELEAWCNIRLRRHHRAVKLAVHVLEPLFERFCSDRDVEVRTAMQSFFQDLLTLYGQLEWPAAELILQTLSVSIITKLRDSTEKSVYTRVQAIEILGDIASKICELHGDLLLKKSLMQSASVPNNDEVEECRVKAMLFLRQKRSLYTDSAFSFLEAMFFSDDHNYATNVTKRMRKSGIQQSLERQSSETDIPDSENMPSTSLSENMQQMAMERVEEVANKLSRDEDVNRSEAVQAFQFVSGQRGFAGGIRTIIASICDGMYDPAPTIRAKSIKALSAIDVSCRGLLQMFPAVVPCIEASCRDVSILTRDAALELLSRSLVFELSRTGGSSLKEIIEHQVQNLEGSEHFENIFEVVMRRMCDSATSVRKRAIGICRAILIEALKFSNSVQKTPIKGSKSTCDSEMYEKLIIRICTGLVQRLGDPEMSVREHAERVLRYGLFGYDATSASTWGIGENSENAGQMARRLTSVYINLPGNVHISFMPRVVHKTMLVKEKPLLTAIVNAAVEELHSYEARISQLNAEQNINSPKIDIKQIKLLSMRRVGCSSVICAFGFLDASLVEPHCRSLAPSIKGVVDGMLTETDLLSVQKILNVLEVGLGKCNIADASLLEEVLQDVELIVCQSPMALLEEAAVKCLCVLAKRSKDRGADGIVERSAKAFKDYLDDQKSIVEENYASKDEQGITAFERHVRCALVRLGLLTRYGSFDDDFIASVYNSITSICNSVCFGEIREVLSKASVRALSHFLIRNRSFLQDGTRTFISLMNLGFSIHQKGEHISFGDNAKLVNVNMRKEENSLIMGIKLCILQGFYELLRDEEERNSVSKDISLKDESNDQVRRMNMRDEDREPSTASREAKGTGCQTVKGCEVRLAAEEDAEAGFLALSAQAMFPHIESCSSCSSTSIRRMVANIVGLLVRQGLLLPASVVPCLFGLLLDQDSGCREYAMRVVSFIAERHSGMLTSAAVPALRSCFRIAYDVYSASEAANYESKLKASDINKLTYEQVCRISIDARSGQSLLSAAFMSLRREERRGVLETVLREFDPRVVIQVTNVEDARIGSGSTSKDDESDGGAEVDEGFTAGEQIGILEYDPNGGERSSLAVLHFFAMTLACIDYTNGSGIGGSLSQGGGTAAAESKLKTAKEEVTELVGIATRIISNSGQAILRAAKHICKKRGENFVEMKKRVAVLSSQMNILLALKHHLKINRWKRITSPDDDRDEEELSMICRMPEFRPNMEMLNLIGWEEDKLMENLSEECADRQIHLLFKLMKEDAIDEGDLNVPSRRGRGGGRGRGRVGARGRQLATTRGERLGQKSVPYSDFDTPAKGCTQGLRRGRRSCVRRKANYIDSESDSSAG